MTKDRKGPPARSHADDLRAATKLVIGATTGVTGVAEDMHRSIASGPSILGEPLAGPARVLTTLAYGQVRQVTRLVGSALDFTLAQLAPLLGESAPGPQRDALQAVLNGVLGDYLVESRNPLAIEMRFRTEGQVLDLDVESLRRALPLATSRIVILVHGSCLADRQWSRLGHDHGAALARDLGYTPVYLHYNTGLHISINGRALDEQIEKLALAWPGPIDQIAILGHSMGGLVARSACHYAEGNHRTWRSKLKTIVCLGSPHHGAPLERRGNWVDVLLGVSKYSAPLARLGKIRSAGVTDLRFGNVLDEDWLGHERFARGADGRRPLPLPADVDCYAIAGSTGSAAKRAPSGDGLVPVDSALGRHERAALSLAFPAAHQWIAFGCNHLDLLARSDVYEKIREWLSR